MTPSDGAAPVVPPDRYRDRVPSHTPYERALREVQDGGEDVRIRLRSSLGEDEALPASIFFRADAGLFDFERHALEMCRGDTLDLGAGTGVHALELQARGIPVLALENCRELVVIMRERGVRRALQADFRPWCGPRFDTVLMLMNGIGPVGTLAGLDRFLVHAHRFLRPGGQLLVDSGEAEPETGADRDGWPDAGDYPGQAWIELEHAGAKGRPFRELYLDLETLFGHAGAAGWRVDVAYESDGGYLARLTPS